MTLRSKNGVDLLINGKPRIRERRDLRRTLRTAASLADTRNPRGQKQAGWKVRLLCSLWGNPLRSRDLAAQ